MKKLLLLLSLVSAVTAAEYSIDIAGFTYEPASLTILEGDTVTWLNLDQVPHTATADDASWDSGTLNHGESWSHTFETAGVWDYYCVIHPSMTGVIIVEADSSDIEPDSWGGLKAAYE